MGFLDRAKELADQAQKKLDEVQTQFNERQQGQHDQPEATQEQEPVPTEPARRADRRTEHAATGPGGRRAARRQAGRPEGRTGVRQRPEQRRPALGPLAPLLIPASRLRRAARRRWDNARRERLGAILTAIVTPFDDDLKSTRRRSSP